MGTTALSRPESGDGITLESLSSTEASSSHCDVVLVNGESNGLSSDCSTESSVDPENSLLQHRDNMCLDAIYNLYAISVRERHHRYMNAVLEGCV